MGVCCVAVAVSDRNIDEILSDPPLVWRVLQADGEEAYLRAIGADRKPTLIQKLLGRVPPTPEIRHLTLTASELREVDLDKSWDGLNACLTALVPGTPSFFEGIDTVGELDVGYSPALYHRRATLRQIADGYLSVTESQLLECFGRIDLSERYLGETWAKARPDTIDYLRQNFAMLHEFLRHTSEHALGAIVQYT